VKINPSRRLFLQAFLALSGVSALGAAFWWLRQIRMRLIPITDIEREIVTAVIDQLIPRDETPGAIDLGVHDSLIEEAQAHRMTGQILAETCQWLEQQAALRFRTSVSHLSADEMNTLLETMAALERTSIPNKGFWWLRDGVMRRYYVQPVTWGAMGLAGAPQPVGFPDYFARPGT
jgi:hypothetical protein